MLNKFANKFGQIGGGALISYTSILINIVIGLLYTPWLVRTIGSSDFALYTLALSVINFFLMDFGMGSAVSKYLSEFYAKKQYRKANLFLGIVYRLYIFIGIISLVFFAIYFFFLDSIYIELTPAEINKFKIVYIIVASYSVISFPFLSLGSILYSSEKFIELTAVSLVDKIITVLLIIVFLYNGYGLITLVTINAAMSIVYIFLKIFLINYKCPYVKFSFKYLFYKDVQMLKKITQISGWSFFISIMQRFIFNIMPTLLAVFVGSKEIAMFGLASSIEGYVYTFGSAINGMFLPRITKEVKVKKSNESILRLMKKIGRIQSFILGLIILGFLFLGKDFVYLWLGKEYEPVYFCAACLIIPAFFDLPQQIGRTVILVIDKLRYQAVVTFFMALVNMILAVIYIPQIGIYGASISILFAYLLRTVGMNILYKKLFGFKIKEYFREIYRGYWLILIILPLVAFFSKSVLPDVSISNFLIRGSLFASIYLGIVYFFLMNEDEKNICHRIFGRK